MEVILRMHRGNGTDRTLDLYPGSVTKGIAEAISLEAFGFPKGQELIVNGQILFDRSTSASEWATCWDARALRPECDDKN